MLSFDAFARILQKARNNGANEDAIVYILKPYAVPQVADDATVPEQARVLGYLGMEAVDLHDNWLIASKGDTGDHFPSSFWWSSDSRNDVTACTVSMGVGAII